MPFKNYFQHVVNQGAHKKVLSEELPKAKHGQIAFHFFEEFTFDNGKKDPLLLVGTVDKSVLDEVRKVSRGEAHGTCAVNGSDQLEFVPAKGMPHLAKLTAAVKFSGMTKPVCLTRDLVDKDGKALSPEQKAIYQKAEKAIQLLQDQMQQKTAAAKGASQEQKERLAHEIVTLGRQLKEAQQTLGQLGWSD
ncbi:MAG TPA: hypothetical protein VNX28_08770, partial [Gemmataceae bacterium]|nr:hypothetical protein [Gemmataceae bacterium]